MSKFLNALVVCLCTFAAKAQTIDNAPWCPPGATWTYQHVSMQNQNYFVFRYTGDTLIQAFPSKVLSVTNVVFGYAGPNGQGAYSSAVYRGSEYYRQSGDSIFWWTGSAFQLNYRLHPQVGDSWVVRNPRDTCPFTSQFPAQDTIKVRAVQKDTLNGRIYDLATVRSDSGYFILGYTYSVFGTNSGRIRSGIGSLETPYPLLNLEKCAAMAGSSVSDMGRFYALVCYSDDIRGSVPTGPAPSQGCSAITAMTTAVSSLSMKSIGIRSWPNPVRGELFLDGVPPRATFALLTLDGKVLRTGALRNGPFSTAGLLPAVYLLQVTTREQRAVLKLLKQ